MATPSEHTKTYLSSDVVVKSGSRQAMEIEYRKTLLSREVGIRSGQFCVPDVTGFLPERGEMKLKMIDNLLTLNQVFNEGKLSVDRMHQVGTVLATIHQELVLPPELRRDLPGYLDDDSSPKVFLHGDFNLENVCLEQSMGKLVILDWHMARFFGDTATYGTPYFDVAWFLNSLFCKTVLRMHLFPKLTGLAHAFLRGYFGEEERCGREGFAEYLVRFAARRVAERRREYTLRKYAAFAPSEILFIRFARSLTRGRTKI